MSTQGEFLGDVDYILNPVFKIIFTFIGYFRNMGFLGGSVGKESMCNAGGPGSISGLGRSAGEGIGYPLQYSWVYICAPQKRAAAEGICLSVTPRNG